MADHDLHVYARPQEAADFLKSSLPASLQKPRVAIVCGSGLGGIQDTIEAEPRAEFAYADVPHFPVPTVAGHAGKLVFGMLGAGSSQTPVVLLVGRAHFYEGHSMDRVTFATRVCRLLNVEVIILTNAAGGLNPAYGVGDIVLLQDHLFPAGLVGMHPLRGPNAEEFGPRFPPLSDAYDLDLRRRAHRSWAHLGSTVGGRKLHEGVYMFLSGPSFETRAECRMLRGMGADVVGMSTVPEIVVARHAGVRVLALSLVTNQAVLEPPPRGDDADIQGMNVQDLEAHLARGRANHEEVLEEGGKAAVVMQNLVKQIVVDFTVERR